MMDSWLKFGVPRYVGWFIGAIALIAPTIFRLWPSGCILLLNFGASWLNLAVGGKVFRPVVRFRLDRQGNVENDLDD
jgi:hypothetical protein